MTDTSPGPGWWLASDGNWYPPHLHPDHGSRPGGAIVDDARPTADDVTVDDISVHDITVHDGPYTLPTQLVPEREPIDWAKVAAERAARRNADESRRKRRIVGATLMSLGTLALLVLVARNRGSDDRATESSDPTTTVVATVPSTTAVSTTAAPQTTLANGSVSVFTLQPGTCVNNPDLSSGLVTTVTEVPCEQAHSHEVYHKVTYTPPDGAYDAERISQFASEQCSQSFAAYVGIPYDRSKYYFLNFAPTEESWTQRGDREVVCLLFLQGSELTGSAKGTAQ
jgi:hypothetical protein